MWEDRLEVHRISVLECQEFSMRQGRKVLTEVSGALMCVKIHCIYRPICLVWSAPDFKNAPGQSDVASVRVEKG